MSGQPPPDWYTALAAAEAWGLPPWEVEDAPAVWLDRFTAVVNERANQQKPKGKGGTGGSAGNARRLI